jgi:hypothetical protein
MYRVVLVAFVIATGCGSRCKEVATARVALTTRKAATGRGSDVRVSVPLARANTLIDELLRAQPVTMPLELPDLGVADLGNHELVAVAREVQLERGAADKVRFAMQLDIHDRGDEVATLALVAEVTPVLERHGKDGAELVIGFGPENLVELTPALGPDARQKLGATVSRWLPGPLRDHVPQALVDAAASKLGTYLTGAAYKALQATLLKRLGELTRVRLRLPDVPIATHTIRSTDTLVVVEITTDLAVRRGLAQARDDDTELGVAMSGSALAELANWAVDQGIAPRWYNRSIEPDPHGEFRPRFDYVAEDRDHPLKVYSFQERGGCSYFAIGVQPSLTMAGDHLQVTAVHRQLEGKSANTLVEVGAWLKFFLTGWIDESKRIATHTRLVVGGRALETTLLGATLARDELHLTLKLAGARS